MPRDILRKTLPDETIADSKVEQFPTETRSELKLKFIFKVQMYFRFKAERIVDTKFRI